MPEIELEIKVGEIVWIKLTGEPVFVLARTPIIQAADKIEVPAGVDMPRPMAPYPFYPDFTDFIVRRYLQSREMGSIYVLDYFTAGELTAIQPNNPQDLLSAIMAAQQAQEVEVEVIPDIDESKPLAN